jgi:hypothetical protein
MLCRLTWDAHASQVACKLLQALRDHILHTGEVVCIQVAAADRKRKRKGP